MNSEYIEKILNNTFGKDISKEIIFEYSEAKKYHWMGEPTNCLSHSAKFCELSIEAINRLAFPSKTSNLNKIAFGKIFENLIKLPKPKAQDEILYLLVPQVLKGIYNIRSKKRVAHMKLNNVDFIDAEVVITNCNWVMSQFIMLFDGKSPTETIGITNSLMEKKLPTIQEFENGELMILKKDLQFKEELLLILYHFSTRLTNKELISILKPKKNSYISIYLKNLEKEKMVHKNKDGAKISKIGIRHIEENSKRFFEI